MLRRYTARVIVAACLIASAMAQSPAKVDFGRDVLPLFRQNCVSCHGPKQQINGLRLDVKSSVFKSGLRRVVPGSSDNSFLYHRVIGSEFGLQMPPTGALRAEQVQLIKSWIDQGAEWPDALANETSPPPANPAAIALVDMLHAGDRQAFLKAVARNPGMLNARGPEGSTPFMYAVLYCDAALLEQLLKRGADPNIRNNAQATALMWAATNLEKARVLLAHGAEVNALSAAMRTPLMIAAGHPGGGPIVKLLLDRGANPNPTKNPMSESSPLIQAALAADAETMRLLIAKGANVKDAAITAMIMALTTECAPCVDLLVKQDLPKDAYTAGLQSATWFAGPPTIRLLLDHGAAINEMDPTGRSPLMYAAVSDLVPVDVVKLLIERGADVNARSQHKRSGDTGFSVLDIARMQGETPVVDLLIKAGARSAVEPAPAPKPRRPADVQSAVLHSLPLIQRTDAGFTEKSGCISCHSNSLGAMAVGLARKNGVPVDETMAARQVKANVAHLELQRDELHQGFFAAQAGAEAFGDTFGPSVVSYILVGLDAEHYPSDLNTDAVAMYLKSRQMPDGRWIYSSADSRQPLCSDYFGQTALSLRALQLYAPKGMEAEYEKAVRLAARWLAQTPPKGQEDRVWRLFGLAWSAADRDATQKALRDVLSLQREDGGWSDLETTQSTPYATGKALVALHTAGLPATDRAYRRGMEWLLNNQMEDGSWYVRTRALAFQPFFDSGFPHGYNQSISAAGTGWAAMALTLASDSISVARATH